MATLISAQSYRFNAMIVGERGSGKTTLVNLLAARLEEEGWHVAQFAGGRFDNAADALLNIARRRRDCPSGSVRSHRRWPGTGARARDLRASARRDVGASAAVGGHRGR